MLSPDVRLQRIELGLAEVKAAVRREDEVGRLRAEVKESYRRGYRAGYTQGRRKAEPTWEEGA
jgi:hypothetical protein